MASTKPPTFSGLDASQDAAELAEFVTVLKEENVRAYGEIGTLYGDTFHYVMSALPPESKGVALDYHLNGTQNAERIARALADLQARGYKVSYLFGDSHTDATARLFRGRGPYDCIFIDGDHSLAGVTADWNRYRGMTRMVAFHDIAGPSPNRGKRSRRRGRIEVSALWKEIKASHRTREILNPGSYQGIGIAWCS